MKKLFPITVLILVAGCNAPPSYQLQKETAPGAALPGGFIAVCNERDSFARCKEWSSKSDLCMPAKGFGGPIPCDQMEHEAEPKYEF